jgi:ubiquinone/menaquinone biosynthesis C-methylase UbiE
MKNSKYTLEQIREFWTEQAKIHKKSPAASWSDVPVIEMEIREIISLIENGDKVIDVGCANGYSSLAIASQRKVKLKGVDYIPEMITEANERLKEICGSLMGEAEFQVGDITDLQENE